MVQATAQPKSFEDKRRKKLRGGRQIAGRKTKINMGIISKVGKKTVLVFSRGNKRGFHVNVCFALFLSESQTLKNFPSLRIGILEFCMLP